MFKFASDFWNSKTTWTAISAIGTAITAGIHHHMGWPQVGFAIFGALFAAFHRDTVAKGNEQAADDRAEMLDHAAAASDRSEAAPIQAGLLPGWGSEVGAILDVFAKHFHSNTINSVAGVIHTLNNLPSLGQAVETATPASEPTTAPAVEPVDGEADKVG